MSTTTLERPTVRIGINGANREVPHTGADVNTYLKAVGAEIGKGKTAVIGGRPVTGDTIVPANAAVTISRRPSNG